MMYSLKTVSIVSKRRAPFVRGFSTTSMEAKEKRRVWDVLKYFAPSSVHSEEKKAVKKEDVESVVVANTPLPEHFLSFWEAAKVRICADGGANRIFDSFAHQNDRIKFLPTLIKGDMDSIRPEVRQFYEKNVTDSI